MGKTELGKNFGSAKSRFVMSFPVKAAPSKAVKNSATKS